ncbi:LCP family protein [Nocardioides aestuarii]|uniref:LCP family protein n=1 Tax=Nocardioides aestuarii TaxID=252231 RepID=A0ABW4TRN2_9ACTN
MSDPVVPAEGAGGDAASSGGGPGEGPKRKGKAAKKHTVGKVLLAAVLTLSIVTGLGVVFFYRHLNGNLNVIATSELLGDDRPDKVKPEGPQEPLNVLVMGSDTRDCDGCALDNETGGNASDTTILMHLSADRERAYGISIPRDSLVDRPACETESGEDTAPESDAMWNAAFSVGGPTCTATQFEALTGVYVDHLVVVNFAGFEDMVDAVGGVPVCIPEDIVDPDHGINIPAGNREISGREALNYVRARYTLGDGSDISRIKRQQAFIAAMAAKVISADTLARVDRLLKFLNAATKSLSVDEGLDSLVKIAKVGVTFNGIGLDNIQFLTVPNGYYPSDSENAGRVFWEDSATKLWKQIEADEPLSKKFTGDAISAGKLPGAKKPKTPEQIARAQERAAQDGLCA